jgi:hypothetical protein
MEYACHYLEDGEPTLRVVVDASNDATILLEAEELLRSSGFVAMEIWQGSRLVGRITLGTPAELIQTAGQA